MFIRAMISLVLWPARRNSALSISSTKRAPERSENFLWGCRIGEIVYNRNGNFSLGIQFMDDSASDEAGSACNDDHKFPRSFDIPSPGFSLEHLVSQHRAPTLAALTVRNGDRSRCRSLLMHPLYNRDNRSFSPALNPGRPCFEKSPKWPIARNQKTST